MKDLSDNQLCYVCGSKNEAGLRVAFEIDRDAKSISGRFTPAAAHQGYEGIVHGGIISALLDEAMAKLAFSLGLPAVTAEMTVKFRSPAAPGEELLVTGRLRNIDRRLILGEAKVEKGLTVIAEATGKLVKV
ncbi:MAG: PaaI family thioesterase [Nitrospirota bacterium]